MLTPALARAVQDRVLPRAPEQTLAQLKASLARAVLAVDPDGAEARHREARRDRRVVITPEADGMAALWALLTATEAAGAFTWLTRLARGLGADDPRSMDARRADILTALLTGRLVLNPDTTPDPDSSADPATGEAGRPIQPVTPGKPLVQVVMAYSTLTGADHQPCELIGHGPIPASLARDTAAESVWQRLVTDPLSGTLLDHGRSTYHPPAGLADHVRARDVHCRFPGCRRTAVDAELDHIVAWSDGGTTSDHNLGAYQHAPRHPRRTNPAPTRPRSDRSDQDLVARTTTAGIGTRTASPSSYAASCSCIARRTSASTPAGCRIRRAAVRTVPSSRASTASSAVDSSQVWSTTVTDTSTNPAAARSWAAMAGSA
jgi:hypothetical protein